VHERGHADVLDGAVAHGDDGLHAHLHETPGPMMLSGLPGVGPLQGRLEGERRERDHPVERDGKADVRHAGLEVGRTVNP